MTKPIEISEPQIIPIKPRDGLVAFASFVLNGQFYIGDIAIHTSFNHPDGLRLAYPARMLANGKQVPIFHPISRESGEAVHKALINHYRDLLPPERRDVDN